MMWGSMMVLLGLILPAMGWSFMPVLAIEPSLDFSFQSAHTLAVQDKHILKSFMESAGPQEWTAQEINELNDHLHNLIDGGLILFLRKVHLNGYYGFSRYKYAFEKDSRNEFHRLSQVPSWVFYRERSINLSDFFFKIRNTKDPFNKFTFGQVAVLHELAHAFDQFTFSSSKELLNLIGWHQVDNRWELAKTDSNEIAQISNEVAQLTESNRIDEAWRISRQYAILHGFPTVYSMSDPMECFAEFTAYLYFDPFSKSYVSKPVQDWFHENVLK